MGSLLRRVAPGLLGLVLVLAWPGCGDGGGEAPPTDAPPPAGGIPANLRTIRVSDDGFSPGALQVPIGTQVFWEWSGKEEHQISGTFKSEEGDVAVESPRMKGSGSFSYEFTTNGLFEYHCAVHGEAVSGRVIIK